MIAYTLRHLSDRELLRGLSILVSQDRSTTAALLAHIAEVEARKLYLPAGYPSMFAYCVHELRLSEQATFKRIRVARAAREFPAIFEAVAAGRLHLSALVVLAPNLTAENVDELLTAAAYKSRSEVEQLMACHFPKADVQTRVRALPQQPPPRLPAVELSRGIVGGQSEPNGPSEPSGASGASRPSSTGAPMTEWVPEPVEKRALELSPGIVVGPAAELSPLRVAPATKASPRVVDALARRPEVAPLSPRRFALHLTMRQEMHDKLRHAQALLGHQVPSGDVVEVMELALDALIVKLEKRKFAATSKPQTSRSSEPSRAHRYIPADVRRRVWLRDGGQCTFVGDTGRRCPERTRLEFDHAEEFARGGEATVEGIRLRCRSHNQYTAEQTFGRGFMDDKRRQSAAPHRQSSGEGVVHGLLDEIEGAPGAGG